MFERYTEAARGVVFFGRYEANQLGSPQIETEHLLLGLLRQDAELALRLLHSPEKIQLVRTAVEKHRKGRAALASLDLPLSSQSKRALALAAQEAERRNHKHIGTGHLALGIFLEEGSLGSRVLRENGIRRSQLDEEVTRSAAAEARHASPEQSRPPVLASRDLTAEAAEGGLTPLIGRERELERALLILSRRTRNNPALVGEPGVGRTAIVEGLAQRIAAGTVPPGLAECKLLTLHATSLIDARGRIRPEERFASAVASEAIRRNVILCIEGLLDLSAAGSGWGVLEATNALEPYLARGEFRSIATGTPAGLRKFSEKAGTLARHFEAIPVLPPSEEEAIRILGAVKPRYETYHGVVYDEGTIEAAVRLSGLFLPRRYLPERAIDLIDEAGARVKLRRDAKQNDTVTSADVEEAVAGRTGVPVATMRAVLQRKEPEKLQVIAKELAALIPLDGHEWVAFLADWLARCSAVEAERLVQTIRAAKADPRA